MTVTLAAGHLKAFDLGKWISLDENGVWVTRKLNYYSVGTDRRRQYIQMQFANSGLSSTSRKVGMYEYIQITAAAADGKMPPHLEGVRPVDPRIKHGDLDPSKLT